MKQKPTNRGTAPPAAKRRAHRLKKHGVILDDPYFWLRRRKNPEVLRYLKAENAYTEKVLKPFQSLKNKLFREIRRRIKETDLSVPAKDGNYFYYTRTVKGKQYPVYCRKYKSLKAREEVLLDANRLAKGHEYFDLGVIEVSPDDRYLAFSVDIKGHEVYTLHVKDLKTGKLLPDVIANTGTSAEWSQDSGSLFYSVLDAAKRPYKIFRHILGTSASKDRPIYHERDDRFLVSLYKTKDRKYMILDVASKTSSELYYLKSDSPDGKFCLIQKRQEKLEYFLDHYNGSFFILTNDKAKNFKLVKTTVVHPEKKYWKTVVPHRENVKLEDLDVCRDHLIVYERHSGLTHIMVRHLPSGRKHQIRFPEPVYSVWEEGNYEFDTRSLRLNYTSPVTPHTVFDYDLVSRKKTVKKRQPVLGGFRSSDYKTERIYVRSHDGVRIPVTLVYRKGMRRNGMNPFLLYGYGSYGINLEPSFVSNRLSLLNRGFIYGIAHVRGGGELGKKWHEDGRMMKKKNSFRDFIACAQYVIRQKYTRPEKLMISGGSAGGLLMAAVVNQRPELFGGVLMHVPFVDVLNTMLDASLPLTVTEYEEWGNPQKKAAFRYIRSYSPYDNIRAQNYPPMFVLAGFHDPRVQYWEPAKWVAKLRWMKTDQNPLILKTNLEAGHMGASGRYDYLKEIAQDYAFLLKTLGISK